VVNHLPPAFVARMERMLGDEAQRFFASYLHPPCKGLRLNTLKVAPADPLFLAMKEAFGLTPVPWCPVGYRYAEHARPGKHPYHEAGLYYIQEPSAMAPVERLAPLPGEIVLDLAAAPGGKATQIAARLQGKGLLLANEIHPGRAKILAENVERCGIRNCVVTSEHPDRLAERFPAFFDKILLDAPCSGEGMFRKTPEAVSEWSEERVAMCARRQGDILAQAARMLKPGGTLVYSTCTFASEENEEVIAQFVAGHREFAVAHSERIWPHLAEGEGHFIAVLRKEGEAAGDAFAAKAERENRRGRRAKLKETCEAMHRFEEFARTALPGFSPGPGEPVLFGSQLYWLPEAAERPFSAESLAGLKVIRPGLHLAEQKKNRIEPAHALAMALKPGEAEQVLDFAADSAEVVAYLRGETLPGKAEGWTVVAVDGYALGWGKGTHGQIKNHYPKGLRKDLS
jgi:NOL1/NOP2/sun family putative RNA methylase